MKILYQHLKLLRPLNIITSGLAMVISSAILDGFSDTRILMLTVAIVMLFTAAANALNDAMDYEIDLVNKPLRPIPLGVVTIKNSLIISFILFSLGSVLCLQLSDSAIIIGVFIAMPMMIFYSTSLKSKYFIGNIAVSLILGMSFLFSGAAYGSISLVWTPMLLAFSLTFVREIVKDVSDIIGDQNQGLKTYPIINGVHKSARLIVVLCVLVGLGSLYPYLSGDYGKNYIITLVIGVEIPLMVVVFLLTKTPSISSATLSASILKFSTIMGLFSIYLGAK